MLVLPIHKCPGTAAEGTPRSSAPCKKLCLKTFSLKLSYKPGLEKVDDVVCRCTRDVPEDLSHSSLETGAEMVKLVLVIPPQVTGHAFELRKERVQAPTSVVLL